MVNTSNFNKIRVAVDWDNVGVPSFISSEGDPLNLIPNAGYINSAIHWTTSSAVGTSYYAGDDYPIQQLYSFDRFNPYGVEATLFAFNTAGSLTYGADFLGDGSLKIPVEPLTDYTFWFYLGSDVTYTNDGDHTLQLLIDEYEVTGMTVVNSTSNDLNISTASYTPVAVICQFTTDSTAAWIQPTIIKTETGGNEVVMNLMIYGMFLEAGHSFDPPTWNAGGENAFLDEITDWVLSISGTLGKTQWENILMDEGALNITLDNQSKRFSPEETTSPLYGLISPYRRIWVLISNSDDNYHFLWTGWTHQITIQTGITNERRATLTARQGLYNIEAQDPDLLVASEQEASRDVIESIFAGGYIIATASDDPQSTSEALFQDPEEGTPIDVGLFGASFVGQDNPSYLEALRDVVEINGNFFFIGRYGRMVFKTYQTVKTTSAVELPYGLTMEANYVYSPLDLYKSIIVNYDIWAVVNSGVEMQGQEQVIPAPSTDLPFRIDPQFNNKPLIGDVVLDVSAFVPVDSSAVITGGSASAVFTLHTQGIYTYYTAAATNSLTDAFGGVDARLTLVSRASGRVWYVTDANQQVTVTGSIEKGLTSLTYNNPLIQTDDQAENFANQQSDRRANILSWYDSATIVNKNATAANWITDHSVGDVIYIVEEQSGNVPKHLCIIGESWTYSPTYFQMTYHLAPTGGHVDNPAYDFEVSAQNVDFTNQSVVGAPVDEFLWSFGD